MKKSAEGHCFGRVVAWQGIGDALAAGDIGLAAKILWLTLKMEWQLGVHSLNQLWIRFKEFLLSTATEVFSGSVAILTGAWASMQSAWVPQPARAGQMATPETLPETKGSLTASRATSEACRQCWSMSDERGTTG